MTLANVIRTNGTLLETHQINAGNIDRQEIIECDGLKFVVTINNDGEVEYITRY